MRPLSVGAAAHCAAAPTACGRCIGFLYVSSEFFLRKSNNCIYLQCQTQSISLTKTFKIMSKNIKGFLGDQRNKLGGAVGYVVNGVQLYRSYTNIVANPKTEGQRYARTKFSILMEMAKAMKPASNIGYKFSKGKLQSGTSVFMKENYVNVSGDTIDELQLEYAPIAVSRGGAIAPKFNQLNLETSLQIQGSFVGSTDERFTDRDDKVVIAAYQPDLHEARVTMVIRSAGRFVMDVPENWSGMKVHVYGFAVSTKDIFVEGTKVVNDGEASKTVYIGSGTIV